MNHRIRVLDCTLRDGGYCNQWEFGEENIANIVHGLVDAGIDIIECGFLTQKVTADKNKTKFTNLQELSGFIPQVRHGKIFVAMMNYGEYDVESLPPYDGSSVDGIRIAFHKKDCVQALKQCKVIGDKGYRVFIQAMVSLNYTDEEFLALIKNANQIMPYAFYIVDSFGMMKRKDLIRLFYMIEHNLTKDTHIGFHSHNNMQLSFSNAQVLADIQTNRNLIIDSSVLGMGRGAGNLNTELLLEYLNENEGGSYTIKPLLTMIDEILNRFYKKNYWGYSLPNYLSAANEAHPNYASYLDEKKTLTIESMAEIFSMMDAENRVEFDQDYIEKLYIRYMSSREVYDEHRAELKHFLADKKVLLIAPGPSSYDEREKIAEFAMRDDVAAISINSDYQYAHTDFIFVSNLRRYEKLDASTRGKCIVTSNIPADSVYVQVKYSDLLNSVTAVEDNAGLMMMKLLIRFGVKQVYMAGFDGYSHDAEENFANEEMAYITRNAVFDTMNAGMAKVLGQYKKHIQITFLTQPRNIIVQ